LDSLNTFFLIIALLLFISVVASRVSSRFGMPLLLVFLAGFFLIIVLHVRRVKGALVLTDASR